MALCFSIFLWQVGCFGESVFLDYETAIFFDKILYTGAFIAPIVYLLTVLLTFPDSGNKKIYSIIRKYSFVLLIPIILNWIPSTSIYFSRGMLRIHDFRYTVNPGIGWFIFLAYYAIVSSLILVHLIKQIRILNGNEKLRAYYFLISSFAIIISGYLYISLVLNFPIILPESDNILGIFFGLIMTYAIFRHNLLDFEVVIKRSTYFVFFLLAVIFPTVLVVNFILQLFHFVSTFEKVLINAAFWTIVVLASERIQQFLRKATDHLFFKADYDFDAVVEECSKTLLEVTDFKMLLYFLEDIVSGVLKTNRFGIFIKNRRDNDFSLLNTANYNEVLNNQRQHLPQSVIQLTADNILVKKLLTSERNAVFLDDLKKEYRSNKDPMLDEAITLMAALDSELLVASVHHNDIKGVVVLGNKKSGDRYTSKDVRLLSYIVSQESLVISKLLEIEDKAMMMLEKDWSDRYQRELEAKNDQLQVAMNDLKIAQDKLIEEEQLAAMGNLAGEVAHDIRNPLSSMNRLIQYLVDNSVITNSEQILVELYQEYPSDPKITEHVKQLLSNNIDLKQTFHEIIDINAKLRKIANDFLEYSKTSKDIPTEKINIQQQISSILSDYLPLAQESKIIISCEITASQLVVMFPQQIERITRNIIDNGLKAIEENELDVQRELSVKLWDDEKWIRLEIKDSGIGMDPDHLSKIFKPFYTRRKNLQGTGLGLAIVKKIIDEAKGTIDVKSELGKGATFSIAFRAVA